MVKNQDLRVNVKWTPVNTAFLCLVLNILCTAHVGFQTTLWATQLPKATHSATCWLPEGSTAPPQRKQRGRTLRYLKSVCGREKSTCLSTSYSLWHLDRNWGKSNQGWGPTCWFGNFVFLSESRVSSSGPTQPTQSKGSLEAQSCSVPPRIQNSHTVPPNTTVLVILELTSYLKNRTWHR